MIYQKWEIPQIGFYWIEKQTWREINDILRLNGFSWEYDGKDSCWIKLV
jgi:hypothetical protein